jgi:hypothetical protein
LILARKKSYSIWYQKNNIFYFLILSKIIKQIIFLEIKILISKLSENTKKILISSKKKNKKNSIFLKALLKHKKKQNLLIYECTSEMQ